MSELKSASPLPEIEMGEVVEKDVKIEKSASSDSSSKKEKEKEKKKEGKVILKVSGLTRNVKVDHLKEIFSKYGNIEKVYFGYDKMISMPTGTSYIKFETHKDAKKAEKYMDQAQIDGTRISASLTSSVPDEYLSHRYVKGKPLPRSDYKPRHQVAKDEHHSRSSRHDKDHTHHSRRSVSPKKGRSHERSRRRKRRSHSYSSDSSSPSRSSSGSSSASSSSSGYSGSSYSSSGSSSPSGTSSESYTSSSGSSSSSSSSSSSQSKRKSVQKKKDGKQHQHHHHHHHQSKSSKK